jgi:hypothetical protein
MQHESSLIRYSVADRGTEDPQGVGRSLSECESVYETLIRLVIELPSHVQTRLQAHKNELNQLFDEYSTRLTASDPFRPEQVTMSVQPSARASLMAALEEELAKVVAVGGRLRCEVAGIHTEIRDLQGETKAFLKQKQRIANKRQLIEADRLHVSEQLAESNPSVDMQKPGTSKGVMAYPVSLGLLEIQRTQKELRNIHQMIRKARGALVSDIVTVD